MYTDSYAIAQEFGACGGKGCIHKGHATVRECLEHLARIDIRIHMPTAVNQWTPLEIPATSPAHLPGPSARTFRRPQWTPPVAAASAPATAPGGQRRHALTPTLALPSDHLHREAQHYFTAPAASHVLPGAAAAASSAAGAADARRAALAIAAEAAAAPTHDTLPAGSPSTTPMPAPAPSPLPLAGAGGVAPAPRQQDAIFVPLDRASIAGYLHVPPPFAPSRGPWLRAVQFATSIPVGTAVMPTILGACTALGIPPPGSLFSIRLHPAITDALWRPRDHGVSLFQMVVDIHDALDWQYPTTLAAATAAVDSTPDAVSLADLVTLIVTAHDALFGQQPPAPLTPGAPSLKRHRDEDDADPCPC